MAIRSKPFLLMGEERESLESSGFFCWFLMSAFAIFACDEVSLAWDVRGPGLKADRSYFKLCRAYMPHEISGYSNQGLLLQWNVFREEDDML